MKNSICSKNYLVLLSLFVSVFGSSTVAAETSIQSRLTGPTSGAHRGGSGVAANTLEQFMDAQANGIDVIEMDLQLSQDNVPVIFHGERLENSSNCKGTIRETTFEKLQKCRLHYTQKTIPSFEAVLAWNQGRSVINAEFKVDEVILHAIDLVRSFAAYESVFFQTRIDRPKYRIARAYDSQVALLYKIESLDDLKWAEELNDSRLVVIEVGKAMANKATSAAIHAIGKVALFNSFRLDTLDETFGAKCTEVFDLGFDIAISNNSKACARQKKKYQKKGPEPAANRPIPCRPRSVQADRTLPCAVTPASASGWSSFAAISPARHWPMNACRSTGPGRWCSNSRPPGATAPRTS